MNPQLKSPFDNPFIQLLTRIAEMMIANFLFLICSLPVVTVGAAAAGLNKYTQALAVDGAGGVFKLFFQGFRENFRQATWVWLGEALIALALGCYYLLIGTFAEGTTAGTLNTILLVAGVLILAVAVYLIPLVVRYENTLRQHLKNAMLLSIIKLPRTIAMTLLALIMPLILYLSLTVFLQTLFFWFTLGFAFVSYLTSLLLKPVFAELEKAPDGKAVNIMN